MSSHRERVAAHVSHLAGGPHLTHPNIRGPNLRVAVASDVSKTRIMRPYLCMQTPDFAIAIMAAGKGTRLKSKRPKVLHEIGGRALLLHVIAAAETVVPSDHLYCIISHEAHVL